MSAEHKVSRVHGFIIPAGSALLTAALACGRPPSQKANSADLQNPSPSPSMGLPEASINISFARENDPSEGLFNLTLRMGYFLRHPLGYTYRGVSLVGLNADIIKRVSVWEGRISIVNGTGSDEREWRIKLERFDSLRPNEFTASWEDYKITECTWNGQALTLEQPSPRFV